MKIIYIAHPIRAIGGESLWGNIRMGVHFYRTAIIEGLPVVAPWAMPLSLAWTDNTDAEQRARALEFMAETAKRCDSVALCGPRVSEGMIRERNACGVAIDCIGLDPEGAAERIGKWIEK